MWDATRVYSTILTTFNGRDQAVNLVQQDNSGQYETPPRPVVEQFTTMTYDGFGRAKTKHLPQQQNANGTAAFTTYNYNSDDSVSSMMDARGAITNYVYADARGLLTNVNYTVPTGSNIPLTPSVSFIYDNLGNRITMNDGLGSVNYEYTDLSQLKSEKRRFNDSLPNAPQENGTNSFKLEYTYALGGGLKSLKDPYGQQFNYGQDKVGRLQSVTGATPFAGFTTYATNAQYRAWGSLKEIEYGNNTTMNLTYNNRLQADHFLFTDSSQQTVMSKVYGFYSDGKLEKIDDLADPRFDQKNTYDFAARPKTSKSSYEARGETPNQQQLQDTPYRQSYGFDAFGNMTQRNNLHWGVNNFDLSLNFVNNRLTSVFNQYDADGRQTQGTDLNDVLESKYDAAGQLIVYHRFLAPEGESETLRTYNGSGREEKRIQRSFQEMQPGQWEWIDSTPTYYIRSSVLGGEVVSDVESNGQKKRTYVRAAGQEIAWQNNPAESQYAEVVFQVWDAAGASYRTTAANGTPYLNSGSEGSPAELDLMGANVGAVNPYVTQTPGETCIGCEALNLESPLYINGRSVTATLDGIPITISFFLSFIDGHQFDFLMAQARMSTRLIGWQRIPSRLTAPTFRGGGGGRQIVPTPNNPNGVLGYAVFGTLEGQVVNFYNPVYSDNWSSAFASMTPRSASENAEMCPNPPCNVAPDFSKMTALERLKWLAGDKLKLFGFNSSQEKSIAENLLHFLASECGEAFKKAGLASPAEIIGSRGITYAFRTLLQSSANNKLLGISEETRHGFAIRESLSSDGVTAGLENGPVMTVLNFWADPNYTFEETIIHELIHAAGVGPHNSWFGGHDLAAYPHYGNILAACTKPK